MTLYEECISALNDNVEVLSKTESSEILEEFEKEIPFTEWGRINWKLVDQKKISMMFLK